MRRKAFLDQHGQLRSIAQLPPLPLLEYLDWLDVAGAFLELGKPPETLYTGDPLFQKLCDRCLELHGIDPDWCSPSLVLKLVFEELPALNQPPRLEGEAAKVSVSEWAHSVIAALLDLEGIRGAIAVAETVPCDLLDGILKARSKQVATEQDEPLDSPTYQELLRELDESLLSVPT